MWHSVLAEFPGNDLILPGLFWSFVGRTEVILSWGLHSHHYLRQSPLSTLPDVLWLTRLSSLVGSNSNIFCLTESCCWVAQAGFELTSASSVLVTGICHSAWLWKEAGLSFPLSSRLFLCLRGFGTTQQCSSGEQMAASTQLWSSPRWSSFLSKAICLCPWTPADKHSLGVRWCNYRLYLLVSISSEITLPFAVSFLVFQAVASYILSRDFCLLCDCSQESKSNLC